ncbi:MAG: hypothetical protein NT085_05510 [candidate division SR1 bacterium]|nr:hypothetical protein [candidate division SR1 bacterium]
MRSTPQEEKNCSLGFSYTSFGHGFIVTTDTPVLAHDNLFNGAAAATRLQKHCRTQTQCDHTICAYKQELVRLLNINSSTFFSGSK